MRKVYVQPGEHRYQVMPFSEVCMHMRVAGKRMNCEVRESSVQLLTEDDRNWSIPITLGEAGFYTDEGGIYVYEAEEESETKCIHGTTDGDICRECAKVVGGRFVVKDSKDDNVAVFDRPDIATYFIEERDMWSWGWYVFDRKEMRKVITD